MIALAYQMKSWYQIQQESGGNCNRWHETGLPLATAQRGFKTNTL